MSLLTWLAELGDLFTDRPVLLAVILPLAGCLATWATVVGAVGTVQYRRWLAERDEREFKAWLVERGLSPAEIVDIVVAGPAQDDLNADTETDSETDSGRRPRIAAGSTAMPWGCHGRASGRGRRDRLARRFRNSGLRRSAGGAAEASQPTG